MIFANSIGQAFWDDEKCNNGNQDETMKSWFDNKECNIRSKNHKFESFSKKKKKKKQRRDYEV